MRSPAWMRDQALMQPMQGFTDGGVPLLTIHSLLTTHSVWSSVPRMAAPRQGRGPQWGPIHQRWNCALQEDRFVVSASWISLTHQALEGLSFSVQTLVSWMKCCMRISHADHARCILTHFEVLAFMRVAFSNPSEVQS